MPNARAKGLNFCREVRKILEGMDHIVEGPGYATAYFQGAIHLIHRDYFGIADLISYYGNKLILHQVTDLSNKTKHIKIIQEKGFLAWVWCRMDGSKVGYRIFFVTPDSITEGEVIFKERKVSENASKRSIKIYGS